MCGIAGYYSSGEGVGDEILASMNAALRHRGPNDSGTWIDERGCLGFTHRRLSVIDLSAAGRQPMTSQSGRHVMVLNGEIYNYADLRNRLESSRKQAWQSASDTEVFLQSIEEWGVGGALKQVDGMFAFAVWDRARREVTFARDRMGEKPLYFGWLGQNFAFASELKALLQIPGWTPRVDSEVAAGFLRAGYVRGPRSILKGLYKLPPATFLTLQESEFEVPKEWREVQPKVQRYWCLDELAGTSRSQQINHKSIPTADLARHLKAAVRSRMVSDVPVGVLLSGGVDSSLIAAMAQEHGAGAVKTFSVGFVESGFNEAPFARAIAERLDTEHSELTITAEDALAVVPSLPTMFDEPFADVSAIPTFLISRFAARNVRVALSGDGGDELFAGYRRYHAIERIVRLLGNVPAPLRDWGIRTAVGSMGLLGHSKTGANLSYRLRRFQRRLRDFNVPSLRKAYIGAGEGSQITDHLPLDQADCDSTDSQHTVLRRLMLGDQLDYLPDDILVKLDRASMASSLEARAPLLSPELVKYSWSLPDSMLKAGSDGKAPLRAVLSNYLPTRLTSRPKQGFDVPIGEWLRSELRDWAEDALSSESIGEVPILHPAAVRREWQSLLMSGAASQFSIWHVLMLVQWCRHYKVIWE